MKIPCILVAHPKGTRMWDNGDITYLSMSHYHGDHVANANSFAGAT